MLISFFCLVSLITAVTLCGAIHLLRRRQVAAGVTLLIVIAVPFTQLAVYGAKLKWASHEWGFRTALPKDIVEISEYRQSDGFLPDYSYYLRARVSRKDFEDYVRHFDLTLHTKGRKYMGEFRGPDWNLGPADWWNASTQNDETYVRQPDEREWTYAKFENGYLYLHSYCY